MSGGKTALGLDANVGAGLCYVANFICYLGIVYSIIVLVTDKTNKLARFHAAQSLILGATSLIICLPGYLIAGLFFLMDSSIKHILNNIT